MSNIIAISLYGGNPLYVRGAYENVQLAQQHYPGWKLWFYTDNAEFKPEGEHVRVIPMLPSKGSSGMFWRFLAAADPFAGHIIFRDSDSRLNPREAAAVEEWMREGKDFHVMRDHPHHAQWPMLGGMWGVRGNVLPDMLMRIGHWPSHVNKLDDMRFLAKEIWPMALKSMTHHSSVETPHPDAKPFPPHGGYAGYVGEIVEPQHAAV